MNQNGGNWTRTPTPTFGQLQRDRMQDGGMYGPNGGDARFTAAPVIPTWDPAAHVPKAPPQVQYNVANDPWVHQVTRHQNQYQPMVPQQQGGGGFAPEALLMIIAFFPILLVIVLIQTLNDIRKNRRAHQEAINRRYQFHEGKWWWHDPSGWWVRYDGEWPWSWPPKVYPDAEHMGDWVCSEFYRGPLPGDDPSWARPPAVA